MQTSPLRRLVYGAILSAALAVGLPPSSNAAGNIEDHIIETETGIYYIVQPGDTLWDLSQQFSDTPWLWPDMWKENQQITNPHLIYPGDRIKLYRRSDVDRYQQTAPATQPSGKMFAYKDMDAVGFIRKQALPPSGVVVDVSPPKTLLSDDDKIFITAEQGHGFSVGEKYTVYRTLKEIRDNETNAYVGIQHLLMGVVEIVAVSPEVATARVDKTFRAFEVGDLVTPYLKRPGEFEIRESAPGLEGKLIATEEHHRLIAQNQTAFIDKGQIDGIEIGQYYTIFTREEKQVVSNGRNKVIQLPLEKLGSVLVLHTEENTATVLIVQSESGIEAWTPVSTPF